MIKSLIYIRIAEQPQVSYAVPLLEALKAQLPGLTTYEFDNFSEENIRLYAVELLKQSGSVGVVVEVAEAEGPISGLTTFFNRLLKVKPESLVLVLQGKQPVLQKMMQTIAGEHFHKDMGEQQLESLLGEFFSGS